MRHQYYCAMIVVVHEMGFLRDANHTYGTKMKIYSETCPHSAVLPLMEDIDVFKIFFIIFVNGSTCGYLKQQVVSLKKIRK